MHAIDIVSFMLQAESCLHISLLGLLNKKSTISLETKDIQIRTVLKLIRNDLSKRNSSLLSAFPDIVATDFDQIIFGFNKFFHKDKIEWAEVDKFVEKSCLVLHVCDPEAEKKIRLAWSAVSRVGSHPFAIEQHQISFERLADVSQKPLQLVLTNLPTNVSRDKLVSFIEQSLSVKITKIEKVESGVLLTLDNLDHYEAMSKEAYITFQGIKINISTDIPLKQVYEIYLAGLPSGIDESVLELIIEHNVTLDTPIIKENISYQPQTSTAIVNTVTANNQAALLSDPTLKIKAKLVDMQTLEKVMCYTDVEVAKFITILEETFAVVPQRIEKNKEALVFLMGSKDFQKVKEEKFKIGGKQCEIVPYTEFRVKYNNPHGIEYDFKTLSSDIINVIRFESNNNNNNYGFIHFETKDSMESLLSKKEVSLDSHSVAPAVIDYKKQDEITLELAPLPLNATHKMVENEFRIRSIKTSFVFIRNGKAYVNTTNDALKITAVKINKMKIDVNQYQGKVPYYVIKVSPLPKDVDYLKLVELMKKTFIDPCFIEIKKLFATAVFADERLYNRALEMKSISIENKLANIQKDEEDSKTPANPIREEQALEKSSIASSTLESKVVPIEKFQCEFLSSYPSVLDQITQRYSGVKISGLKEEFTPKPVEEKNKKKLNTGESKLVTLSGPQSELESAFLKFNGIVGEIKTKELECKFGPHEVIFKDYIENKLATTAIKNGKVLASVSFKDQRSFVLFVVTIVALDKDITKCSSLIKTVSDSLTSEEYVFPGTVPPLEKVEQDFDVKIVAENNKHRIFGQKETISEVKDHLNKMIGCAVVSEVIILKENEGYFFHRFLAAELTLDLQKLSVKLVQKGSNSILSGKKEDVVQIKSKIQTLLSKIAKSTFDVKVPVSMSALVKQYLLTSFEKSQVQFLVIENKNVETDITIEVCHSDSPVEAEYIKSVIDRLKDHVTKSLEFSASEYSVLKALNLKDLTKKLNCIIKPIPSENSYKLYAFAESDLMNTENYFLDYLNKNYVKKISVKLLPEDFHYVKSKKMTEIESWKQQYGATSVVFEKSPEQITITGKHAIDQIKEEIVNLTKKLKRQTVHILQKEIVSPKLLDELKKNMEAQYDLTFQSKAKKESVTIIVVAPEGENWQSIEEDLSYAKMKNFNWSPADYDILAKSIFTDKTIDVTKFKNEWSLSNLYFNKDTKTVEFSAQSMDDINSAKKALEAILNDKKEASTSIDFKYEQTYMFINKKEFAFNKALEALLKTHKLSRAHIKDTKRLTIRGSSETIKTGAPLVKKLVDEVEEKLCIEYVNIPAFLADDFMKDSWKLQKDFFHSTNTVLTFSTQKKVHILTELKAKTFTVQVVQGSIVHTDVEYIVDSANEDLKPYSGIAKFLADKAGPDVIQECNAYIAANKKLQTGNSLLTTAGKLPFLGIIHTVGPVWQGGQHNEKLYLKQAVESALLTATRERAKSIAIPTISSGTYGYPKEECTLEIVKTVINFFAQNNSTIKTVKLCDIDPTVLYFLSSHILNLNSQDFVVTNGNTLKLPEDTAYEWSWEENDKTYVPFDNDQNLQIEVAYLKQQGKGKVIVTGDLNRVKNNFQYEIDFDNMTEINTQYRRNRRPIRRLPKILASHFWEYHNVNSEWKRFDPSVSSQLELAFDKKEKSFFSFFSDPIVNFMFYNQQATVDIKTMKFTLQGLTLDVRRIKQNYESDMQQYVQNLSKTKEVISFSTTVQTKLTEIELLGLPDDIKNAKSKLVEMTRQLQVAIPVDLGYQFTSEELKKFVAIGVKCSVDISPVPKQASTVMITGPSQLANQCKAEIMEYLFRNKVGNTPIVTYPQIWEPQNANLKMVDVPSRSSEWTTVQQKFNETLKNRIVKIERIQNKWLWEKHLEMKKMLDKKNNNNSLELSLFHGTRTNNPSLIYNGEKGFDNRYCDSGMWGIANYFAQNASYSHAYSFVENGVRKILLAKVLVGECTHIMPNNPNLRKPPFKSSSNSGLGFKEEYDSVSGDTNGSRIYMIYENGRAYPEYLMSYQ